MTPLQMPKIKCLIAALFLFGVTSCANLPRLIILHDPLSAEEHLQLGGIYESQGEWDSAISEYRAALKKEARLQGGAFRLGNAYYQNKNYAAAEKAYHSALRIEVENAALLNNLANLYLVQKKKLHEAEALVQKAIKLDPPHAAAYLDTLGSIYLTQEKHLAALESYGAAERLSPESSPLKSQISTHKRQTEALLKKQAESIQSAGSSDVR